MNRKPPAIAGHPMALTTILRNPAAHDIYLVHSKRRKTVRAMPGFYNTLDEISESSRGRVAQLRRKVKILLIRDLVDCELRLDACESLVEKLQEENLRLQNLLAARCN